MLPLTQCKQILNNNNPNPYTDEEVEKLVHFLSLMAEIDVSHFRQHLKTLESNSKQQAKDNH